MKRCAECGGEGGFEVPYSDQTAEAFDALGGDWLVCEECGGAGYVEGTEGPLDEIDLDDRTGPVSLGSVLTAMWGDANGE